MNVTILLMYICWAVVGLVWLMGALYNMVYAPAAAKQGARTSIITIIGLTLIIANDYWGPTRLWHSLVVRSFDLSVIGTAVLVLGTAFTLWARLTLGTMWSSSPVARVEHSLKTTGPYAVTRNPIYTGLLTMFFGTVLIKGLGVWAVYFVVGVIFIEFKIHLEEHLLTETFGETYARYRQTVPQLIPGIHLFRKGQHAGG